MTFDLPFAGGSINGRADECQIADGYVGWSDDGELCLLINECDNGHYRVGGCK